MTHPLLIDSPPRSPRHKIQKSESSVSSIGGIQRHVFLSKKDIKLPANDNFLLRMNKLFEELTKITAKQEKSATNLFSARADTNAIQDTHYSWGQEVESYSADLQGCWDAFNLYAHEVPFISSPIDKIQAIEKVMLFYQRIWSPKKENILLRELLLAVEYTEALKLYKTCFDACEKILQNNQILAQLSDIQKCFETTTKELKQQHSALEKSTEELLVAHVNLLHIETLECLKNAIVKLNPVHSMVALIDQLLVTLGVEVKQVDENDFVIVENSSSEEKEQPSIEPRSLFLRDELQFPNKTRWRILRWLYDSYRPHRTKIDRLEEIAQELQQKEDTLQSSLNRIYKGETVVAQAAWDKEINRLQAAISSIKKELKALQDKNKVHGVVYYAHRLLQYVNTIKEIGELLTKMSSSSYQPILHKHQSLIAYLGQPVQPRKTVAEIRESIYKLFQFVHPLSKNASLKKDEKPEDFVTSFKLFAEKLLDRTIGEIGKQVLNQKITEEISPPQDSWEWVMGNEDLELKTLPEWLIGELERQMVNWLYFSKESHPPIKLILMLEKLNMTSSIQDTVKNSASFAAIWNAFAEAWIRNIQEDDIEQCCELFSDLVFCKQHPKNIANIYLYAKSTFTIEQLDALEDPNFNKFIDLGRNLLQEISHSESFPDPIKDTLYDKLEQDQAGLFQDEPYYKSYILATLVNALFNTNLKQNLASERLRTFFASDRPLRGMDVDEMNILIFKFIADLVLGGKKLSPYERSFLQKILRKSIKEPLLEITLQQISNPFEYELMIALYLDDAKDKISINLRKEEGRHAQEALKIYLALQELKKKSNNSPDIKKMLTHLYMLTPLENNSSLFQVIFSCWEQIFLHLYEFLDEAFLAEFEKNTPKILEALEKIRKEPS